MAELEEVENPSEWYNSTQDGGDTVIFLGEGGIQPEGEMGGDGVSQEQKGSEQNSSSQLLDGFKAQLSQEMAGQLWQAGKQSTQNLINTYAHIDYLRPYFDVEPQEFMNRLLKSFIPDTKVGAPQQAASELYGPTMLVFTLVAILLYGMKTSGHTVEDGTLMGTALAVCLGYWIGVSSVVTFMSFLFNAHLSLLQVLSLIGYSMTAHCTILMFSTLFDHYGIPTMFYLFLLIIGGLTALKTTGILISRSWTLRDGLVLSGIAVTFHFLSILYLRFAYHKVYEAVAEVL